MALGDNHCGNFQLVGYCTDNTCTAIHDPKVLGNPEKDRIPGYGSKVCKEYLRGGYCKYGDTCKYKYSHGAPERGYVRVDGEVCRHFVRRQSCRWGNKCKFSHLDKKKHVAPSTPAPTPAAASVPRRASPPWREVEKEHAAVMERLEQHLSRMAAVAEKNHTAPKDVCIICADNEVEVAYAKCGHLCLCIKCSESTNPALKTCPLCKRTSDRVRIYRAGL